MANTQYFGSKTLPTQPDCLAPDGCEVRTLLALAAGSMAHFTLHPGQASRAVQLRTVEEIWYVLGGEGEMWRRQSEVESVLPLAAGCCFSIPLGTCFQFRALGSEPLTVVAVTMPPWPGDGEVVPVEGRWVPTLGAS